MPYTIAHGVLGLEGTHTINGVALAPPGYRMKDIPGLRALPDREDPRTARVGRPGENDYPTSPLGKTVGYVGDIEADDPAALLAAGQALRAAMADTRAPITIVVAPNPADPFADVSSPTWQYTAKVLSADIPDTWAKLRFAREFTLGLRMSDARFYVPALAVDETGDPVTVTNVGDAPADPVITIAGASGLVVVSDGTHELTFADVPAGDLVLDFAQHTAMVGTEHAHLITSSSDWWDSFVYGIEGGATVTIGVIGGSSVQVQFTPGSW